MVLSLGNWWTQEINKLATGDSWTALVKKTKTTGAHLKSPTSSSKSPAASVQYAYCCCKAMECEATWRPCVVLSSHAQAVHSFAFWACATLDVWYGFDCNVFRGTYLSCYPGTCRVEVMSDESRVTSDALRRESREFWGFESQIRQKSFENNWWVVIHSPQSLHFILLCYHRFEILSKLAIWWTVR